MITLNINYKLDPTQSPELNARFVAEFAEALAAKGYALTGETVKPVKSPTNAKEIGPKEQAVLAQTGKKWMKVPKDWEGTREQWAEKLLNGEPAHEFAVDNADPLAVFSED